MVGLPCVEPRAFTQGLREHFLTHMSRTELEHLVTALEAVLDGEGSRYLR
jgi:hypothetical protein